MVREVDASRQPLDSVDGFLSKGSGGVQALVRLNDERDDELEVLLNVCTEREECVEDLHLRVRCLVIELALEHFENRRQYHRDEWLELRIECLPESLDKRHEWELEEDVVP